MPVDLEDKARPAFFSGSTDSLSTIQLLLNREGIIEQIHANPLTLLIEPPEKMVGKNWFETSVPNHARQYAISAFRNILSNEAHTLENQPCPILTATHSEKLLTWCGLPRLDNQQSVTGIWLSGVDLSSQLLIKHNLDIALKRAQINAQIILDNAVEAIITISSDCIVQSLNKSATTIFGYSSEEVVGQNISMLMPAPYKEKHDHYIKHYLQTGQKKIIGIGREVVGLRKNGEEFPMELSVSEVKLENEHTFTGMIRDISERKEADIKLQQRDEELRQTHDRIAHMGRLNVMGEMATGIAHELNQPLTAIATYAQASSQLLDSAMENTHSLSHSLSQINEQAQRAGEVIRRLRSMATKQRQTYEQVQINDLILESIELANIDSRLKDIAIDTDFSTSIPSIELDVIQIQQVLLNLIRNAVDVVTDNMSSDSNKHIHICTTTENDTVKVSVVDNGPGLLHTDKNEIFNPFFTTKEHGMGMGLALCRSIITAHGGELDINTENKNGTEFYFSLPIYPIT